MTASYVALYENGGLARCADRLGEVLRQCKMCPHRCGVDRFSGNTGRCKSGSNPIISSFNAHFGEEAPLVGKNGSGTIFFTHCTLDCVFCQNYDISHLGRGEEITHGELAEIMLHLQRCGCHNINFVSPTHMNYAIAKALEIAVPLGLSVPLVYNTGGYDSTEILEMMEGVYDIFMPDFKYMDPEAAGRLSGAANYPNVAMAVLREMHRQVGDLECDPRGVAHRGLIVRHLVLPNDIAATERVIDFIAGLSKNTYINIMDQYRPEYHAKEYDGIKRRVSLDEFDSAIDHAIAAGLWRIDGIRDFRARK